MRLRHLGDENHALMFKRIAGLPYIRKVDMIESSYKLMDRRSGLSDHIVRMGETEVGKDALCHRRALHDRSSKSKPLFRNRPRPERGRSRCLAGRGLETPHESLSYQGDNKALSIILQAREETGLPIDVEVMDAGNSNWPSKPKSAFFKWEPATP